MLYEKVKCSKCGHARRKAIPEKRKCIICKTPFKTTNSHYVTCGAVECRKKRERQTEKAWAKENRGVLR